MLVRIKPKAGKHRQGDQVYGPGDEIEVSEVELAAFGDKFERIVAEEKKAAAASKPASAGSK